MTRLNYAEIGKGETLILLHGNGEDMTYFSPNIEDLSQFFHLVLIDTPGHGKSERGEGQFTLERFSDDLYSFIKARYSEKINILGFSDGANIALIFALKYQDMLNKLILYGGNAFPRGLKRNVYKSVIRLWKDAKKRNDRKNEELLSLMVNEPQIKISSLKRLTCPTLLIYGTDDEIKLSHARKINKAIHSSSLVLIEGTHFLSMERPEAFDRAVISFLKNR